MPISFNHIPDNLRVPLFWAEVDNSRAAKFGQSLRALIVGQMLSTGSATADEPVLVTTLDQAKAYFGVASNLAHMYQRFRDNDAFAEVWCLPVDDDGAAVKATGDITFTGPATAAGALNIYIAGRRVRVAVAAADSAAEIATAVAAAITADTDLPVTAAVNGVDDTQVDLTARHGGEIGNDIDVRMNYLGALGGEATPAGVGVTITAMNSGATNPDLDSAIAAMGDEPFDFIIIPWTDATSLNDFGAEMNDTVGRWSYLRQLYGGVFSAKQATVANLTTFGNARNDQHVSVIGFNDSPTPAYEWAAAYGAQATKALSLDPARPLQTLPLLGVKAPPASSRFTTTEKNTLLYDGVATSYVDSAGVVRIERAISTYQTNEWSQPDPSYLDVNTLFTLAEVLRRLRQRILTKYPRHKLASDGTRLGPGQAVVTPVVIRSELVAAYQEMERDALVENAIAFEENLIVERNADDPNRLDVLFPPDLVNQLRVFALLAQFRLQYPTSA